MQLPTRMLSYSSTKSGDATQVCMLSYDLTVVVDSRRLLLAHSRWSGASAVHQTASPSFLTPETVVCHLIDDESCSGSVCRVLGQQCWAR